MMINANSLHKNCLKPPLNSSNKLFNGSTSSFHGRRCGCDFNLKRTKATTTTTVTASVSGGGGNGGRARGDYKRIPMDTAGAYQLIDEKSGEKYIVWGGADDDFNDSVVTPSKDVLAWTPPAVIPPRVRSETKMIPRGAKANQVSVDVSMRGGGSDSDRLGRSFGRLRSDSVRRVLARKTSTIRKEDVDEDEYDDNVIVKKTAKGYREFTTTRRKDTNEYGDNVVVKKTAKSYASGASSPIWRKDLNEYDGNVVVKKTAGYCESNELKAEVESTRKKVRRKDAARVQDSVSETTEFDELRDTEMYLEKGPKYENKVAEVDAPAPKKPSAYLSKWGDVDGESVGNFRTEAHGSMQRLRKTSNDNGFFSRKSFKELGCNDYMIESLRSLLFLRPSQIQAMAIPPVVQGKSCIITDQSGSGKTLAYLVPVIQRLREEELQGLSKSISQSPRVVILVPTAELASQVLSNCRAISKSGVPFRSMVVTGGFRQKTQLESLQQELDVLIATPGRFLYLVNEGFLQLKNLRCVVLDEVDLLYRDEDFNSALQRLMNFSPLTTQYLFVTATLPIDAYNKLVESFPDCEVVMGPSMHRVSSGLEEVLVDCSGDYSDEKNPETAFANKKSALLQIVEGNSVSKTIIFCNKIETCRKVENILTRSDRKGVHMRVLTFHAALTQESRLANMKEFLNAHSEKDSQFLVCTDRASRGIDFAGVDHVILFDFPRDPSEYVRRVGRTARGAGGKGTAFVFVVGKQVSLARRIMERNQKGQPLHDVPYV